LHEPGRDGVVILGWLWAIGRANGSIGGCRAQATLWVVVSTGHKRASQSRRRSQEATVATWSWQGEE
jgi:GH24 family phage-related lysozyme (muramidase)